MAAIACVLMVVPIGAEAQFLVRDVESTGVVNGLSAADALLGGTGIASEATVLRSFIDMFDADWNTGEGTGHFLNNQSFPNNAIGVNDNDFVLKATGFLSISSPGTYTFGVNSDDGSRLRIDLGSGYVPIINDDTIHAPIDKFGSCGKIVAFEGDDGGMGG